jgi:hypothetical protein
MVIVAISGSYGEKRTGTGKWDLIKREGVHNRLEKTYYAARV